MSAWDAAISWCLLLGSLGALFTGLALLAKWLEERFPANGGRQ